MNNISAIQEYDVYTPGQDFLFTSKDNMFVAWKVGEPVTMMQYIRKTMLQYQKEWLNGLTLPLGHVTRTTRRPERSATTVTTPTGH